jgi:hypothetical protein
VLVTFCHIHPSLICVGTGHVWSLLLECSFAKNSWLDCKCQIRVELTLTKLSSQQQCGFNYNSKKFYRQQLVLLIDFCQQSGCASMDKALSLQISCHQGQPNINTMYTLTITTCIHVSKKPSPNIPDLLLTIEQHVSYTNAGKQLS